MKRLLPAILACLSLAAPLASGRDIRITSASSLSGQVVIAEWFYEKEMEGKSAVSVPREFRTWPDQINVQTSDDFSLRIEAHPGDRLVLSPGQYVADLFVFTPNLTITTEENSTTRASIWGTVEIDADGAVLDGIAVTGARKGLSSGHGIEVNRVFVHSITIRNCRVADKDWTGIHLIGPNGEIDWLRVENCELVHNGLDGMDAQSTAHLVVTGCTITDNGWNFDHGVGVRIGSNVTSVEMTDNVIARNRFADVSRKD